MEPTRTLIVASMMTMMMVGLFPGLGNSDLEQDRAECAPKLGGLATCLPYVQGQAKSPTKDCCGGFGQVVVQSKKCVCLLIKDRNDPRLGLSINASLAVHIPAACHQTAPNITNCISLLHLPPNSAAAKEFESLGKMEGDTSGGSTPSPSKGGSPSTQTRGAASSASLKSDGGTGKRGKSWLAVVLFIISGLSFFFI